MKVALAVAGITTAAVRVSSTLWTLSRDWRDAPVDLHNLRDDVTRTERFFGEIQQTMNASRLAGPPTPKEALPEASALQSDLRQLIDEGISTLRRIEAIVDGLVVSAGVEGRSEEDKAKGDDIRKRRKFLWLLQSRKVAKLRKELSYTRSNICRLLITRNM